MRPSTDEFGDFRWPVTSSRSGEDGERNLQTRPHDEACVDFMFSLSGRFIAHAAPQWATTETMLGRFNCRVIGINGCGG